VEKKVVEKKEGEVVEGEEAKEGEEPKPSTSGEAGEGTEEAAEVKVGICKFVSAISGFGRVLHIHWHCCS
jgi:hypothetical protein